jgi:hypothetical protein
MRKVNRRSLIFTKNVLLEGYSKARIIKYLDTLERIARDLGKPLTQAKKGGYS